MAPNRAFWRHALATCTLWLAATVTHAAELGPLTLHSYLGQALSAEIEIRSLRPGEEKGLYAQLAPRAAFGKAGLAYNPALAGVRVSIVRHAGRRVVRLRTSRPISEPILQMMIELHWSTGGVVAVYNVLLDPPGYKGTQALAHPPTASSPPAKAVEAPAPAPPAAQAAKPEATPALESSREELFGLSKAETSGKPEAKSLEWHGYVENYTAYDYADPAHWSRGVVRAQIGTEGGASGLGSGLKWKITARVDVDPVYGSSSFYPADVRKDQRLDAWLRETYIDTGVGNFNFRLGKQNIVWGEMVGLFFADVVSARDLRDFILPNFETIRIPQWAARAEYFGDNSHFELIWLPYPEIDNIGKPGAEFYPFQAPPPPGFSQQFNDEVQPAHGLSNTNYGIRASTLQNGWDLSAFYYRSTDASATFYREVTLSPTPTLIYTPRHDRIWQAGGTLAKAFESVVAKAELVYTSGRSYNVTRLTEPTGVVPQDTLDYVVGLDFTLPRETRLNVQYFERAFYNYDPDLLFDRREGGVSLLLSGKIGPGLEPELFVVQSVNRRDRMVRASIGWVPATNWRLTGGVVTFTGPPTGFFGRFNRDDRVYVQLRRDF
jgi:hypothetical protein